MIRIPKKIDKSVFQSRQKRGFRTNSASRVAHGYGKRGGYLSLSTSGALPLSEDQPQVEDGFLPKIGLAHLADYTSFQDEDDATVVDCLPCPYSTSSWSTCSCRMAELDLLVDCLPCPYSTCSCRMAELDLLVSLSTMSILYL